MVDFSTLATLAPHLAGTSQDLQDATRAMVTDTIGASASDERVKYLWLHFLTLVDQQATSGGSIGSVTSLTVGSISLSGGSTPPAGSAGAGAYGSTVWGQLYEAATRREYHATAV